jgi:RNA polymerase sigma factor (sigma-70 family)
MADVTAPAEYADFIRRLRAGDEQAAVDLVKRYEAEIRLEIRTWLRLRDPRLRRVFDSMDVCQSVLASFFLRAAVGAYELDQPQQLIRLLVGMARHKLAEQVKHHHRQRRDVRRAHVPDTFDVADTAQTPSQQVAGRELLAEMRKRLTPEEQQVAELRARGCDWTQVATQLGGTPEGRRKQLRRAVARLEVELGLDESVL